ncbi:vitelline membrane-like protein [Pithys albifrons albifrons]|uniref:vitelline membrane-like protein n=1 Tax=Pithys albifrons albifrons TaxID=3385563 RepID=UPI003A5CD4D2
MGPRLPEDYDRGQLSQFVAPGEAPDVAEAGAPGHATSYKGALPTSSSPNPASRDAASASPGGLQQLPTVEGDDASRASRPPSMSLTPHVHLCPPSKHVQSHSHTTHPVPITSKPAASHPFARSGRKRDVRLPEHNVLLPSRMIRAQEHDNRNMKDSVSIPSSPDTFLPSLRVGFVPAQLCQYQATGYTISATDTQKYSTVTHIVTALSSQSTSLVLMGQCRQFNVLQRLRAADPRGRIIPPQGLGWLCCFPALRSAPWRVLPTPCAIAPPRGAAPRRQHLTQQGTGRDAPPPGTGDPASSSFGGGAGAAPPAACPPLRRRHSTAPGAARPRAPPAPSAAHLGSARSVPPPSPGRGPSRSGRSRLAGCLPALPALPAVRRPRRSAGRGPRCGCGGGGNGSARPAPAPPRRNRPRAAPGLRAGMKRPFVQLGELTASWDQ